MRPASSPRRDDDDDDDEKGVVVDLEQRLESVETHASLLTSSSAAKDDIAKNDDDDCCSSSKKHSAKLFTKLARLRSALVESRPAGNAASSEGEKRGVGRRAIEDGNEIKRLHDRLESVLFQIAVVGNATIGKNAVVHSFGRSARAIARDCLVLTFSLGNRYCHSLSRVSFRYALLTPFLSYVLMYIQTDKVYSGLQTNF